MNEVSPEQNCSLGMEDFGQIERLKIDKVVIV